MLLRSGIPLLSAIAIAIVLVACDDGKRSAGGTDAPYEPQPALTESEDSGTMPVAFWKEFQDALKAGDAEKIAGMTRFPADIGLAGIEGFEGINQREGFIRHFDAIFPEEAVDTLLATSAADLKLQRSDDEGETEHYWSLSHDHKDPLVSEVNWNVGYVFSRQPDGSIQLTKVAFAG